MKNLPNILAFTAFAILCFLAFLGPKNGAEVSKFPEDVSAEIQREIYPVKVTIQSIGIDAPIESVGILDGAMAVPTFGHNVGWYSLGTNPGETGSTVLAGHVNWKNGETAVFTNLQKVQIGDLISVTNNYGGVTNFKVTDIKKFPLETDTTEIFSSSDGKVRLNLITCVGEWNDYLGTHSERLVVFAEKI